MLEQTKAIVLSSIKYGESDLIVKCYTLHGVKTYLIKRILKSKSKKLNVAYFQPLTQLELNAYHNNKGNLNSIREARVSFIYATIQSDIIKQSIVMFLSEVLSTALNEEENNSDLFNYLETTFRWFDTHDKVSNFHLLFLINLTKYLGFYPEYNVEGSLYFDLAEGQFVNHKPHLNYLEGEKLNWFKMLIGINFDALQTLKFNSNSRQEMLEILLTFYGLHIPGFKSPKSLTILKEIFR